MTMEPRPDEEPGAKDPDPPIKKDKPVGWINSLADRSTGLPNSRPQAARKDGEKSPWTYAGIGIQFAATTALFAFMGMYVDRWTGWTPWATVGLTLLGLIGGLYLLIKDALRDNAGPPSRHKGRKS